MQFPYPIKVADLASKIRAKKIIGDEKISLYGINEIHKVKEGDLTFVDHAKYYDRVLNSSASAVLINQIHAPITGKALLVVSNPFGIYNGLVQEYRPFTPLYKTTSPTAQVHPSSTIEPNVILGNHVTIGKNCYIQSNVVIRDYTTIGDNVQIQSGTIIGADAFYYHQNQNGYTKWCSGGRVIIENKVEIGASCTICKGVSGDTIIGEGTKLDCQVHIGHGVEIGKHCLLAAQVGIGGKTIVGNNVILYGQVGVGARLIIEDDVAVLGKSGVTKNLKAGKKYFGYPAGETNRMYKELASLRSLPRLLKQLYQYRVSDK